MSLDCEEGKAPVVIVEQARYLPAGSEAPQTGPWQVPVCFELPGRSEPLCELLTEARSEVQLGMDTCPAWYYPNAGQVGYYRWSTDGGNFERLLDDAFPKFSDSAKVEFFSNASALSNAELLDAARYLTVTRTLGKEKHRTLVRQVINVLYGVEKSLPDDRRAEFQKVARRIIAGPLKRVGYEPQEGEAPELALLRPTVLYASAYLARDRGTLDWAKSASTRFLKRCRGSFGNGTPLKTE